MERGELVPTKIIQQVILATVTDTKYAQKGFILNGVCRCQETFEFVVREGMVRMMRSSAASLAVWPPYRPSHWQELPRCVCTMHECNCEKASHTGESCRAWWLVGTPLLWLV